MRQLRNVVESAVVLATSKEIPPRSLPEAIRKGSPPKGTISLRLGSTLADAEREMIIATLAHTNNNRAKSARQLGIGRKTLYRKIEEYGIE